MTKAFEWHVWGFDWHKKEGKIKPTKTNSLPPLASTLEAWQIKHIIFGYKEIQFNFVTGCTSPEVIFAGAKKKLH